MYSLRHQIKKIAILSAAGVIGTLSFSPVRAQTASCSDTPSCLLAIAQNTYATLQAVNTLPNFLSTETQVALSWLQQDTSSTTTAMQASFATLGNLVVQDYNTQLAGQLQITADLLGQPLTNMTTPTNNPMVLSYIPNVNDLSYLSIMGQPPVPKATNASLSSYNYLKNAAGVNISHIIPGTSWQGKSADQARYQNYFNTVIAVESFNGYALSNQYADVQNGNSFTTTQNSLISQASASSWIVQISTEQLGVVIRQLLMFESQSYILLSQLVQTQKQLLSAQVMTNSLLILNNQNNESYLVAKAQGVQPTA